MGISCLSERLSSPILHWRSEDEMGQQGAPEARQSCWHQHSVGPGASHGGPGCSDKA